MLGIRLLAFVFWSLVAMCLIIVNIPAIMKEWLNENRNH